MAISVLVIEDDARFRDAFLRAIAQTDELELAGSASDYATGLHMLGRLPDVMLVDLQLPDGNGLDLIREAARLLPRCDIVVVSVFGDERNVLASIEAGAAGYLLKDLPAAEILRQIHVLREGGSPISPIIARQLLTRFTGASMREFPPEPTGGERPVLSDQEQRVLSMAAKGYSYDEIAVLLQVSPHTVQTYVRRIYRKLQVTAKIGALSEARRLRLIAP